MVDRPIPSEDVGAAPHWQMMDPEDIRRGLEQMPPGARKDKAYSDWARSRMLTEQAKLKTEPDPARTAVDYARAGLRGLPFVGGFVDEATAGVKALMPGAGGYDENVAYWRDRDKTFAREHPVVDPSMALVGGTAGMLAPPLRGAQGASMLANTAGAFISGFGEGEGSPFTEQGLKSRSASAVGQGVPAGVLSTVMGPGSRYINRYSQGNVTPEVEAALARLGINNAPYFVRSGSELTQAEGRRNAQTSIGTPLNQSYGNVRDQFGNAAANVVTRTANVGPHPAEAPWSIGQTIDAALRRSAEGAQTSRGVIAEQTNRLMPPGAQFDPAGQRAALGNVVGERASTNMANPMRGLEDHLAFGTAPTTWEGSNAYNTRLGQAKGLPQTDASPVGRAELAQLYAGHQGVDRPNFVEQILGPAGRARFMAGVAEQERLGNLQRGITATLAANPTPEQLVGTLLTSGSTKGPTNLNAFNMIMGSLSPSEQREAAAGVLAQIVMGSQVQAIRGTAAGTATNPGAVANAINRLTPIAREALFPVGSNLGGDVEALRQVGQRIGQVNQYAGTGSSASLGKSMTQTPVVSSSIKDIARLIGIPQAAAGVERGLQQYGLPAGLVSMIDALGTSGARLSGRGASPYLQDTVAPFFVDRPTVPR